MASFVYWELEYALGYTLRQPVEMIKIMHLQKKAAYSHHQVGIAIAGMCTKLLPIEHHNSCGSKNIIYGFSRLRKDGFD